MDIIDDLILNVAILFLMMIPGVILRTCGLVSAEFGKGLSNLVLYIAQPALIVCAYATYGGDGNIWLNSLWVLLLSALTHLIFAGVALLFFRRAEDGRRRMLRMVTVFSNAAFMGIPLISEILDSEAVIYASIYNIPFNIFLWSLGVYFCTARRDEDGDGTPDGETKPRYAISPLKVALHPVNIAAVIGIVLLALRWDAHVPAVASEFVVDVLTMLKHLVAPLAMFVIGLRLPEIRLRDSLRDGHAYLFLALRHFLLPGVIALFLWLLLLIGLPLGRTVVTVVLLLAATPAATSATMFAEKYDCDVPYTGRLVIYSTLLSILSMPVFAMLADLISR